MIRGILHFTDGAPTLSTRLDDVRPPTEGFVWIDVYAQTRADLDLLGERFAFHPLALEDCEHLDQRPKLEEFDGHLFLVLHTFVQLTEKDPTEVDFRELHIFFGRNFLVTVHEEEISVLNQCWSRSMTDVGFCRSGADKLLYRLSDALVDHAYPILECLSDEIESTEDQILNRPMPELIHRLLHIKRSLVLMRRLILPQREIFNQLLRRESTLISEQTMLYFRDVYDHLIRCYEMIDNDRDLLANARDAHFAMLSQRTNVIITRLTIISIVFLPLTFLTGFFGMNFTHMPFDNDYLLLSMVVAMILLPSSMLFWFRYRRWLN